MADKNDIHWSDDDEILSQFVLHQLSRAEEERLSSHLAGCEKCRQAVEKESRLITGIKLAGREQLKDRLKSRLVPKARGATTANTSTMSGDHIPWIKIAGIAATVAIIISVGIYNNWFLADYRLNSPTIGQITTEQPQRVPETIHRQEEAKEPAKQSEPRNEVAQRTDLPAKNQTKRSKSMLQEHRADEVRGQPSLDKEAQANAPAESRVEAKAEAASGHLQKQENTGLADQAMTAPSHTFWVTGQVLSGSSGRDLRRAPSLVFSQAPQSVDDRTKAKKDVQGISPTRGESARSPISLKQEPVSSLPPEVLTTQDRPGTIHAFVEDHDSTMQVTLFLDSLVSDSELKAAKIDIIHDDSLLLHFSGQRVGVGLPPSGKRRFR